MKKLDGLRFLQQNFPNLTVDCLFVDKVENLKEEDLHIKEYENQLWRVRAGNKSGSELNLPQGTFSNTNELRKFIEKNRISNPNMEYVIHRVTPEYFAAPFVGTLAVYNSGDVPTIRIELQKVTKELVESIDKGKRPRDWEVCLVLNYDFLYKFPKILKKSDSVNLEEVKNAIIVIHEVGEQIFDIYERKGERTDSYTRFNIYNLGKVVLDDHRSSESFLSRIKYDTTNSKSKSENINKPINLSEERDER